MNPEMFDAIQELKKIGVIGVHEHCRGLNKKSPNDKLAYKATISEVLKAAAVLGLKVICDMPNTDPATISEAVLISRIETAKRSAHYGVKYMIWFGLTADPEQIAKAVYLWKKYPEIVGLKMFAGKSTLSLAVITEDGQRIVYKTLAALGYMGVIAVHCEDEKYLNEKKYDPNKPWTHALARPEIAETFSTDQQIRLISKTGFLGRLHVCHVSCHESVNIIDAARKRGMKISCGITPQTLLYSIEKMEKLGRVKALLLKCNPPIRTEANRLLLIKNLRQGKIDVIETDHAPHSIKDKLENNASGVMSLFLLPKLYVELRQRGFNQHLLEKLLKENALKIFPKSKV